MCNQTLGCLRLYGDSRVSQTQPRINDYELLLQHDWLLVFSRQNRFAETHSHLQLSYHITDRLLAAGNNKHIMYYQNISELLCIHLYNTSVGTLLVFFYVCYMYAYINTMNTRNHKTTEHVRHKHRTIVTKRCTGHENKRFTSSITVLGQLV